MRPTDALAYCTKDMFIEKIDIMRLLVKLPGGVYVRDHNCKSRATTMGEQVLSATDHSHLPDESSCTRVVIQSEIKTQAVESPFAPVASIISPDYLSILIINESCDSV